MTVWFEDPEFWRLAAPVIFPSARVEGAGAELDLLLERVTESGVALPASPDVLDMPCGVGRHSIAMAARGARVTGVDLTDSLLVTARERAQAAGVDVTFVRADMREYRSEPGAYDLALNLYSSLGYACDRATDVRILANLRAGLRDTGALVIETNAKEILAASWCPSRFIEADGYVVEECADIVDDWSRARSTFIVRRDREELYRFTFELSLYAASELKAMLREAGFAGEISCFGNMSGGAYGPGARRLVMVARA